MRRQLSPMAQHFWSPGNSLLALRLAADSEGTAKKTSTWYFPLLFMISHHAVRHYRRIITVLFICEIYTAHDTYLVGASRISEDWAYTSPQIINFLALPTGLRPGSWQERVGQEERHSAHSAQWGAPDAYCMTPTLVEIHHCIFFPRYSYGAKLAVKLLPH